MTMTESHEQTILAQWLDLRRVLWCHVPNGGARSAIVGAQLRRHGVKRGVPDVLIFTPPHGGAPYVGTAIELKTKRGRLSPEQKAWMFALGQCNWLTHIAHGAMDAIRFLQSYGY